MNVLLVDVDSKIANLALMKLSTFHKMKGDQVRLYRHRERRNFRPAMDMDTAMYDPDLTYVSCLFTWNRPIADGLIKTFSRKSGRLLFGGTGFDHGKPADSRAYLPIEAEHAPPDYEIYPPTAAPRERFDYAIGFCLRGCNRSCQFCDVPKKEGKIRIQDYRPPWTWVPDDLKKAMLLDNDIELYPDETYYEILKWFRDQGVRASITQGNDIRCMTPERAAFLRELRPWDLAFANVCLYTAWDYLGIEPWVRSGLGMLLDAGFRGREIRCYTILGFDPKSEGPTPVGDLHERAIALHRFRVLWQEFGVYPYAMPYNNRKDDPWINSFVRFCNKKQLFKSMSWEDYKRNPETPEEAAAVGRIMPTLVTGVK